MDYCTPFFGKKLQDVTIDDVKKTFEEERLESDWLEFKSIKGSEFNNKQFENIKETVAAMLNSAGGLLIWGAP